MPRNPRPLRHDAERIRTALHLEQQRRQALDAHLAALIRDARAAGLTWNAIGTELGVSGGKAWHLAHNADTPDAGPRNAEQNETTV